MEDERISILMKYVQGEISFAEWIEGGVGACDAEQDDNSMQVDREEEEEMQTQMVEASESQVSPATSQDNSESTGKYIVFLIVLTIFAARLLGLAFSSNDMLTHRQTSLCVRVYEENL